MHTARWAVNKTWMAATGLSLGLAASAAAQGEPYTFRMVAGGDTVTSEVVARSATRVDVDMIYEPQGARFRYAMTLAPGVTFARGTDAHVSLGGTATFFQSGDWSLGGALETSSRGAIGGGFAVA